MFHGQLILQLHQMVDLQTKPVSFRFVATPHTLQHKSVHFVSTTMLIPKYVHQAESSIIIFLLNFDFFHLGNPIAI